jgi:hypothetical protein
MSIPEPGLARVLQANDGCRHVLDLAASELGNIHLSVRFVERDCTWCQTRLVRYWRDRAKAGEAQHKIAIGYLEQALAGTVHRGNAEAFLDGNRKPKEGP